jgi:hypothetical protein
MSVSAIGATLNVTDDIIILSRPAREDDYIYTDSPINHAGDLISAGEKIADRFLGEFHTVEGRIIAKNGIPLAVAVLNLTLMASYPDPA